MLHTQKGKNISTDTTGYLKIGELVKNKVEDSDEDDLKFKNFNFGSTRFSETASYEVLKWSKASSQYDLQNIFIFFNDINNTLKVFKEIQEFCGKQFSIPKLCNFNEKKIQKQNFNFKLYKKT